MEFNRIFVAIDFSAGADEALRRAHSRAASTGSALAVCHIIPNDLRGDVLYPHFATAAAANISAASESVRQAVAARVREVTGRAEDAVSIVVDHGNAYAEILKAAENWRADLIVIGSHGMTGLTSVLLGSVTHRVIRHAHAAVFIARDPQNGGVVAGTDFSDPSFPAISAAADESRRTGKPLIVVHSIDVDRIAASYAAMALIPPSSDEGYAKLMVSARERVGEALQKIGSKGETLVATGRPGPTLISVARDRNADLIVVGTVGLTGLSRVLLGSVAETVASQAPCSVLVTRLHPVRG